MAVHNATLFRPVRIIRFARACDAARASSYASAKPFDTIPKPKEFSRFGGALWEMKRRMGKADHDNFFHHYTRLYGPIWMCRIGWTENVILNDPEALEVVMRNEGKFPSRSDLLEWKFQWIHKKHNIPDGLIFSSGENWRRLRSAMAKQVIPRRLASFTPALSAIASDVCNHLSKTKNQYGVVDDIWPIMQTWALKGISKVVYDEDAGGGSGTESQREEFVQDTLKFIACITPITISPPIFKIFPTRAYREYVKALKKMRAGGSDMLKKRFTVMSENIKKGTVDESKAICLLDQWLIEGQLTETEAVLQAADQMSAGTDTTSNTATFMIHELAKKPAIQEALWREVVEVVGPNEEPAHEQLQKLPLVRDCVRETLRLNPVLVVSTRTVMSDVVLLGYQIPAGTDITFNLELSGKDEKYFTDPLQFNPYRWRQDKTAIHPFSSIPFGYGPRMCYGRRIAELELYLLLVHLLRRYRLSTDQTSLKLKRMTVLQPDEPVTIAFTERDTF